jgi:hypothetical protein
MSLNDRPHSIKRKVVIAGLVVLCLAFTGWLRADSAADDSATFLGAIAKNFANWVAQGALWGVSISIFALWIALTWTVVKLYTVVGDYILPTWDITSGTGGTFMGQNLPAFMCIDPYWAHVITNLGSIFYLLAATLVFVLVAADGLKIAVNNEDGSRVFANFGFAFVTMVLFPYLYTGIILLANEMTLMIHNYTTAWFPTNAVSILNALTKASIFGTMDSATQAKIGVGSNTGLIISGSPLGANDQMPNLQDLWSALFSPKGNAWDATGGYVTSTIEMFISRIIQIVLCVMALVEIIALFLLKGAQIAGMVINYFLGIIACAMLASPKTRPIFFQWLKAFIEISFWGFIWSLLFLATWLIVSICNGLKGFDGAVIGSFLFPMLLFGTLKKFREVAGIISGFAVTGVIASGVGKAMESGFNSQSKGTGQMTGQAMQSGGQWGSKMIGAVTDKASAAAMSIPGVGTAAAFAIQAGGRTLQAAAGTTAAAGKAMSGMSQPTGKGPMASALNRFSSGARSSAGGGSNEGAGGSGTAPKTKIAGVYGGISAKLAMQKQARDRQQSKEAPMATKQPGFVGPTPK